MQSWERLAAATAAPSTGRARILRWGALVVAGSAVLALAFRLLLGPLATWLVALQLLLAAVVVASVWMLRREGSETLAGLLVLGCTTGLIAVSALDRGGLDAPVLALLPFLPVAAAFLLGSRAGWIFAGVGCLVLVGLLFVQPEAEVLRDGSMATELVRPARAVWLSTTLLLLAGVTWLYERRAQQLSHSLRVQATSDRLTGLANRRHFETSLEEECRRATRDGRPVSVILLDVDHFKAFNDSYGHSRGDLCLVAVAFAITTRVRRSGELVARFGGEEFVALLPGLGARRAAGVAESIRMAVEELKIPNERAPGEFVSVSLGVASGDREDGLDPRSLIERADQALYRAKQAGRNRVVVFESAAASATQL